MKRLTLALVVTAGTAAASYYIDERFDGAGLPPGWTCTTHNHASWDIRGGGPWGNYMELFAAGDHTTGTGEIYLTTPQVDVSPGKLYYRYEIKWTFTSIYSFLVSAGFKLYEVGNGTPLVSHPLLVGGTGIWYAVAGSVDVNGDKDIYGQWYGVASYTSGIYSYLYVYVDTVQFNSEDMAALAPASLGRVKVLFR
jgi:hypothetical protein